MVITHIFPLEYKQVYYLFLIFIPFFNSYENLKREREEMTRARKKERNLHLISSQFIIFLLNKVDSTLLIALGGNFMNLEVRVLWCFHVCEINGWYMNFLMCCIPIVVNSWYCLCIKWCYVVVLEVVMNCLSWYDECC